MRLLRRPPPFEKGGETPRNDDEIWEKVKSEGVRPLSSLRRLKASAKPCLVQVCALYLIWYKEDA